MRKNFILLLFLILGLFWPIHTYANINSANNHINNIRYGSIEDGVRIVFDLDAKIDYRAFVLEDPYRLVIDIPNINWKHAKSGNVSGNRFIKSYRSGILDNGLNRVVFDLKEPALIDRVFHLDKNNQFSDRLVVDIKGASRTQFLASRKKVFGDKDLNTTKTIVRTKISQQLTPTPSITSALKNEVKSIETQTTASNNIPARKPVIQQPIVHRKKTVVIDAGHGGADPGAVLNGYYEKNITLAIAKVLQSDLQRGGKYNVVMTRDKDVYITLKDRKEIARKVNADLFISIHADSINRSNIRGASIYTLSETASDAETARLAESENNAGFIAGVDLSHESVEVANILLDLSMRSKMNESNMFAKMLEDNLRSSSIKMLSNPRRSAGFAVLKAPDVPSILVEAGFLSNLQEAKLLSTPDFKRRISKAIANSVDSYFRKIDELQQF